MSSEASDEFEARYNDRVRKTRKAAALASKELDRLRLHKPVTLGVLDAEVARIAQEKLQP
jgi:hypothetical protein